MNKDRNKHGVYIPADLWEQLQAFCEKHYNVSCSAVIFTAIKELIEREGKVNKSAHTRLKSKEAFVQDRLRHRGIYCVSAKWIKWAKRYINRSQRRKRNE